ncbi:hypothetical protein KO507_03555 [Gilvimarinus agarilyticus]|uniref:3-oxoacyl-ACP synthase n=1 Tax=Reichenbachiella TaxID=156993 RepID=UPI000E6C305A|nr:MULTISPECIES: 3-oxoacyl-ACP synthase [Reichenbachiella]MBU2884839.1 hypothetical protein [Gilvimarinus agarilyticus]MBU2913009.1 3-oxoacyl-ACP synthase [Reichenbachiella agariperforans]RJE72878.1 hypothetical protein BGP76_02705 [Reichenbachiella sp. MSK19-1]
MSQQVCHIKWNADGLIIDGQQADLLPHEGGLKELLAAYYKSLGLNYPKFHKMDNLSKLGVLGVAMLSAQYDLSAYADDAIAMHFQNASASLDTDWVHQQNINEGKAASPANFVYTLPNIVLGEIAIRNKWYGENLFVVADSFDLERWMKTNQVLFDQNKAEAVLGGWVEVLEEKFELELYFVVKQ